MSRVCPKDLRGCCDDLCYGGGCLRMHGAEMVELCKVCGQPDGEFASLCRCLDDEYPDGYLEDEEL